MREQAPSWIYETVDHFRRELFPEYSFRQGDIYLDDLPKKSCLGNTLRTEGADLIIDRRTFARNHFKFMPHICHEFAHEAVGRYAEHGSHGPAWQGLMRSIGLEPIKEGSIGDNYTQEIVRDGLFWQSYFRLPDFTGAVKAIEATERQKSIIIEEEFHHACTYHLEPRAPFSVNEVISAWNASEKWAIFVDSSGSMLEPVSTPSGVKARIRVAREFLCGIWHEFPGARLFQFPQNSISPLWHPRHVTGVGNGTCFRNIFYEAASIGARKIFIISDGGLTHADHPDLQPGQHIESEVDVMAGRAHAIEKGVELISTHYIGHPTAPSEAFYRRFLESLRYGRGSSTIGQQPKDLAAAMDIARRSQEAPAAQHVTTATPRDRPDFTVEVRDGAEAARYRTEVNKHTANLTDVVGNAAHRLSIADDRLMSRAAFGDLLAGTDHASAQVFAQQQAQFAADQRSNEAGSAHLRAGFGLASDDVRKIFTGAAQKHAASVVNVRDTSAPVQIGGFDIDLSAFSRILTVRNGDKS